MMVEAQKIFTDTTMQDTPTDFRVLTGSFRRRVRLAMSPRASTTGISFRAAMSMWTLGAM